MKKLVMLLLAAGLLFSCIENDDETYLTDSTELTSKKVNFEKEIIDEIHISTNQNSNFAKDEDGIGGNKGEGQQIPIRP